jgi:DNA topoisomerase-1
MVWLARWGSRGEAISWHLAEELKLDKTKTTNCISTKSQNHSKKAIDNPREIDYNLVNAQQARRFRPISGLWTSSPVLWKKLKEDFQQVVCNLFWFVLIVERERVLNFNAVALFYCCRVYQWIRKVIQGKAS